MVKKTVIFSIIILIASVLAVINSQSIENTKIKRTVIIVPTEQCTTLSNQCTVNLNGVKLKISFDQNIYYLKPFNVTVEFDNSSDFNIDKIFVDFKMKNMNMGINRFSLKNDYPDTKNNKWLGIALLPICVTGRADWTASFEVTTNNNQYLIFFPLDIKKSDN